MKASGHPSESGTLSTKLAPEKTLDPLLLDLLSVDSQRPNSPSEARSRKLLLLERTMYREGCTPFTSVFTIRLRGTLSEPRLRHALAQIQAKHPLLRCVVEGGTDGPSFVLRDRPAPIPLRIVERETGNDWDSEVRREWVTPFRAGPENDRDPLVRMVWLRGSETHELILVGHHCICDGPSGITLLRECLSACDNPEQGLGSYGELGSIHDLVPAKLTRKRGFRVSVRWRMSLLRLALLLKSRKSSAGNPIPADQMYFHRWQLDRLAAHALILRCKEEGVTVFAAVSIAVMQAFRHVRGECALTKAYAMVNARRFMPHLHPDAMFGIAPGVSLSLKGLPPAQHMSIGGFWNRARVLRKDLKRRIDRLGAGFYQYLVGLETLHDRYSKLVAGTEAAPAVRHITVSNMGLVELPEQYKNFQVEEVFSPLVMVSPSPANTLVLSSFAGRLEFAIVSDEHSLPREQALAIQARTMEILRGCVEASPRPGANPRQQMQEGSL
jgi:Condensation domain